MVNTNMLRIIIKFFCHQNTFRFHSIYRPDEVPDGGAVRRHPVSPGDLVRAVPGGGHQLTLAEQLRGAEAEHLLQRVRAAVRAQEVIEDAYAELVEVVDDNIHSFEQPVPLELIHHISLDTTSTNIKDYHY